MWWLLGSGQLHLVISEKEEVCEMEINRQSPVLAWVFIWGSWGFKVPTVANHILSSFLLGEWTRTPERCVITRGCERGRQHLPTAWRDSSQEGGGSLQEAKNKPSLLPEPCLLHGCVMEQQDWSTVSWKEGQQATVTLWLCLMTKGPIWGKISNSGKEYFHSHYCMWEN